MKILVILPRFPFPLEKGDKLRAYNFIKYLSLNHKIYLYAISDQKYTRDYLKDVKVFCEDIKIFYKSKIRILFSILKGLFVSRPFQVEYFYSSKAQAELDKYYLTVRPDVVFCQLIRVSEFVKKYPGLKILDYMDAFSKGVERRREVVPFYLKLLFTIENARLLKYEEEVFDCFDIKIIISNADRMLIPHKNRSSIYVVPNGVDDSYFTPIATDKIYDVAFIGNMAYPPNIHAALYLVKEIYPYVKRYYPNMRILLGGANPHKSIRQLESECVHVSGWVEDIRDAYNKSKMMVAPLQIGTGLQNKVLEAMCMKLPCITSPLVNESIGALPGAEILVARSVKEYAEQIIYLLENEVKALELAERASQFVKREYQWCSIIESFEKIFNKTIKKEG